MSITVLEAIRRIDDKAGAVRACYITVAPGQEATYLLKAQQAEAYRASDYYGEPPTLVAAEAMAYGIEPHEAADRIVAQEAAWTQLATAVELVRRSGKVAVEAALTSEELQVALDDALEQLAELMP